MTQKERMSYMVKQGTIEKIVAYQVANGFRYPGDALDYLITEATTIREEGLVGDVLATAVADRVINGLKNDLTAFRIRTGYADKQTKAILEVLNHIVVKQALDVPNVITTDVRKSNVLQVSQDKIQREIEHFKQAKDAKKNQESSDPTKERN